MLNNKMKNINFKYMIQRLFNVPDYTNNYLIDLTSIFNIITHAHIARRYHGEHGHFKPPSMDELPVPQGSWQAQYDANQRRYNSILLFGIAFTAGSIIIVCNLYNFYEYVDENMQMKLLFAILTLKKLFFYCNFIRLVCNYCFINFTIYHYILVQQSQCVFVSGKSFWPRVLELLPTKVSGLNLEHGFNFVM